MKTKTYNEAVKPYLRDLEKTEGLLAETTRQFSKLRGREISRQQVAMWLHSNPASRVEPSFTTAHMLFKAVELAKEAIAKRGASRT
mgnify:FL=1